VPSMRERGVFPGIDEPSMPFSSFVTSSISRVIFLPAVLAFSSTLLYFGLSGWSLLRSACLPRASSTGWAPFPPSSGFSPSGYLMCDSPNSCRKLAPSLRGSDRLSRSSDCPLAFLFPSGSFPPHACIPVMPFPGSTLTIHFFLRV